MRWANKVTVSTKHMNDSLNIDIEKTAVEISIEAGRILSKHFGKIRTVEYKGSGKSDPVSLADREAHDYIKENIARHFPDHGILSEEDEDIDLDADLAPDYLWIIDPLDGTKNFIAGLPIFGCSIGVLYRGTPIAGAIYLPWPEEESGIVIHARKNNGTFIDGVVLPKLKVEEADQIYLVTLPGSLRNVFKVDYSPRDQPLNDVRVTGSIAYELALVAKGVTQYSITTGPKIWDVAAGIILVTEAGGIVMQRRTDNSLQQFFRRSHWEAMESFIPDWRDGETTMGQLRLWGGTLISGHASSVTQIICNFQINRRKDRFLLHFLRR